MNATPKDVAAGLSGGQARAILAADESGRVPLDYPKRKATGRSRIMHSTLANLQRAGLITFHPPALTPLGLAVRAILQAQKDSRHG